MVTMPWRFPASVKGTGEVTVAVPQVPADEMPLTDATTPWTPNTGGGSTATDVAVRVPAESVPNTLTEPPTQTSRN